MEGISTRAIMWKFRLFVPVAQSYCVKDSGQGFSLEDLRHAAINSPAGDPLSHSAVREEQGLRPGGFGLLLAKKQEDDLIYNEKGSEVLLIKYINPLPSQAV
jgi:hypothetical protein